MSTATQSFSATGRRKNAIARITMSEGTGNIIINGRAFDDYLPSLQLQNAVLAPFQSAKLVNRFDLAVSVKGGGLHGQAGAIRLAVSRALTEFDGEIRATIKPLGYLRRDPRMKERKKAGQPGARKRYQFSKR